MSRMWRLALLLLSGLWCVQGLLRVSVNPTVPLFTLGSRSVLVCEVSGCRGDATFSWVPLEDRPLAAIVRANATTSWLTFDPVRREHEGALLCKVSCGGERSQIKTSLQVYAPPSDPEVSGPLSVSVGVRSSLVCSVKDMFPPELLTLDWIRADQVLLRTTGEPGSNMVQNRLDFTPQSSDQDLDFTCRARMDLLELSPELRSRETRVQLQLLYAPVVTSMSPSLQALTGSSVVLNCSAEGHPTPSLSWSFIPSQSSDSDLVQEQRSEREQTMGFGPQLELGPVTLAQSGVYRCHAQNSEGNSSRSSRLSVHAPPTHPRLSSSPEQPLEGRSLTLTCQSDGAPPPTLVLSRSGEELQRQNHTHSLSFSVLSAQLQDSAHYVCESTNEHGEARAGLNISIRAHPLRVNVLQQVTAADAGSSLVLTCETHGCSQSPVLTWTKTDPAPDPVLLRTTDQAGSRLVLKDLDLQDSGLYSCEAQCDSVTRRGTTVVQVYSLPSDPLLSLSLPVVLGHPSVFACSVFNVFPLSGLRLQWLMGNESVQSQDSFPASATLQNVSSELLLDQILQTSLLHNPGLSPIPTLSVSCRAEIWIEDGEVWRTRTSSAHVHLHYAPMNVTISANSDPDWVLEGRSLTLTCQSDGAPPPTLVLSRNGAELQRQSHAHSLSFSLLSAQLQDSAHYLCESTNEHGAARGGLNVTVRAPPRNTSVQVLPSAVVFEGMNITVCCSSVCAPPPSVYLRKLTNGTQRLSSDGTFLLVNVSAQDSGLYQVNISNELGFELHVFSISVRERSVSSVPSFSLSLVVVLSLCAIALLSSAAIVTEYIRRARKKGFYQLPQSNPQPT